MVVDPLGLPRCASCGNAFIHERQDGACAACGGAFDPGVSRGRGRPAVGQPVEVRLPEGLLRSVDRLAAQREQSRAATIRDLLEDALNG